MSEVHCLTLQNQSISVKILPKRGALVSSLIVRDKEVIHQAEDFDVEATSWPSGGIPVLFPFAGRVFNGPVQGEYLIDGEVYRMPIHGFAYGVEWEVSEHTDTKAVMTFSASDVTKALYPWNFDLVYTIELSGNNLVTTLDIKNMGQCGSSASKKLPMPVSPGFHPYLKVYDSLMQVSSGGLVTKYDVTGTGALGKDRDVNGDETFETNSKELKSSILSHEKAFNHKINTGPLSYKLESDKAKYTVFWTDSDEQFQCVEPWVGLPDSIGFTAIGSQAEGVHPLSCKLLSEGESFSLSTTYSF